MKAIVKSIMILGLAIVMTGMVVGAGTAQSPSDGLVPTVRLDVPGLGNQEARRVGTAFTFPLIGEDPDSPSGRPVKYRTLLISAQYDTTETGEPRYIRTAFEYNLYGPPLIAWDDLAWTAWEDYPDAPEDPLIEVAGLNDGEYYLLAMQVMDADGAVSIGLNYQVEVFNFQVQEGSFRPEVTVCEVYLGCSGTSQVYHEIASGQPLNFSWVGDASYYGGEIVSYRHGWDLIDPADPNDPGWAVPPGLQPENLYAPERAFQDGLHRLTLKVVDSLQQERIIRWDLDVVPYVSPENQLPLMILDQTVDANSQAWTDETGLPRDNQVYRNAYWQFLSGGSGSVAGVVWDRDYYSDVSQISYRDLVIYKVVLCYARSNDQQTMFQQFRPQNGEDRYVWLTPYQYRGGNYFQVGDRSMESFLEQEPNYMIPIIFDTNETTYLAGGNSYIVGFGQVELPDGSVVPRGPRLYPYATAGIAALDWTSPGNMFIYGRTTVARFDRDVDCVGLKGLALDPDFRAYHGVTPGAIVDTLWTDPVIDWHDVVDAAGGNLNLFANTFPFRSDEFTDVNITDRTTPVVPQDCAHIIASPDGMCVEPMFTGISRMDWMREVKWSEGDPDWPFSEYSVWELEDGCGPLGLTSYQEIPLSSSRTHGHTYGYLSYRMVEDKPSNKADVYWGFDPYRFDHEETKKAIRWVLDYFGLKINP
jgi:hypothetical protein